MPPAEPSAAPSPGKDAAAGVELARAAPAIDHLEARIAGILFADVVNFSGLATDEQVVAFSSEVLGAVARYTESSGYTLITRNTWGDGLYFVFEDARAAGLYALGLCDVMRSVDWTHFGLPGDLDIRVAVHAGPLYRFVDPVLGQPTWSGKQVVRAARMEPITPPGTVYASREFAAIAAAERIDEFRCEPVGRVRLAKKEGLAPICVVQPCARAAAARPGRTRAPEGR
jgi:class 3 adenylate cyclase